MGLLLAAGKSLKHLKEKSQHKIPYHDLNFLWRRTASRIVGLNATLRLLVQPHDEADYYYYYCYCPFPGN
jgi:hypothetical protein